MSSNKSFDILNSVEQFVTDLSSIRELNYHFSNLKKYANALFDDFCPVRIGDRVVIINDVVITNKNSEWRGSEHFLKHNMLATVISIDYLCNKKFSIEILPDIQSYIYNKQAFPCSKNTYVFHSDEIRRVSVKEENDILKNENKLNQSIRLYFQLIDYMIKNEIIQNAYVLGGDEIIQNAYILGGDGWAKYTFNLSKVFNNINSLEEIISKNVKDKSITLSKDCLDLNLFELCKFIIFDNNKKYVTIK